MNRKSKNVIKCIMTFVLALAMVLGAIQLPFISESKTVHAAETTLSGSDNYTANNGDVLTGSTSGTVTIASDANVTLSDATITGGIICDGSATITLVGTNSVTGIDAQSAGIQIGGSGTTLTIKGDGSLTANGGYGCAGIGLSRAWDDNVTGGDIVIEGGNITANGGSSWGAGIGTGVAYIEKTATLGNITIKGGLVKATGGSDSDGIGTGYTYSSATNTIGTVTIYDDIDLVDASSIKDFANVVYMHETTDVTANKTGYFTITEDGDRRSIMQKDDTDYNVTIDADITCGTVTVDKTTAKAGEFVTLTITPASGYGLQSFTVKDASDNDVSVSNNKFIMVRGGVTVSATFVRTTAAFNETTGVLTLNGNVVADEVKAYRAIKSESGYIKEWSRVTSVVCEPGTVLPADCSELFLDYLNESEELTIDLSNADVSGVTNMSKMFASSSVTTIYVNSAWSMENVTSSDLMFYCCTELEGGNGTEWEDVEFSFYYSNGWDWEAADVAAGSSTYAIIDGKDGQEGYLTHKKGTPVITTAPSAKTDLVYNGEEQELITAGTTNFGDLLSYSLDGVNYSADIPTETDAGTYTVYYKVENSDNWNEVPAQTIEVTIAAAQKAVTSTDINITIPAQTYTGSVLTPAITVKDGETVLTENTDYTVTAPSGTRKNAGNYIYTITGMGDYTGETTATFTINPKAVTVKADNKSMIVGTTPEPELTATVSGTVGNDTVNYSLVREAGTTVGTYTITPRGDTEQGNYTVSYQTGTFTITSKVTITTNMVNLSYTKTAYTGKALEPKVTVENGSKTLTAGTDYTISYKNNKNIGKATVTITGKGSYTGVVNKTFTISAPAKGKVFTVSKCKYKITDAKKYTVSITGTSVKGKLTIGSTVKIGGKSYKITSIAEKAFKNNTKLTSVVIGENVSAIGKQAFYGCKKLKTIVIKTTKLKAKNVGNAAFKKVSSSVKVTVPKEKKNDYKKLLKKKSLPAKAKVQ
ncbi:MBG domain-containing protein [Eubacterium oxidoreducens]|uniref:Surface protein n=1 Tax=Eubacterium oxidoreducens TaxID=1732 RepID=A0A1G6CT32_EUBOX|nr:MBG domain-containing protein [Eubacterium oxidoreducens]SDB36041.1 protein of unknown function, DUF285 [Eubacterium oxidoreducens]